MGIMGPVAVSSEGEAPFDVPQAGKSCRTWYKIFGRLAGDTVPLVALHGGPGVGHDYLLSLVDLTSQYNIPLVLYDQIGCARSTALPEKNGDDSFWTVQLFEDELSNLIKHLGITQFDLFGHSWGGMLATSYATKQPSGLRKLILMGSPASIELHIRGITELRTQLSEETQKVLKQHEAKSDFQAPAYKEACMEFYNKFVCRCDPWPAELLKSLSYPEDDPTVYETMFGPSELLCLGNLKTWTEISSLHNIQSPTLIMTGEFDSVLDFAAEPLFEKIPKAKWLTIPKASHVGMWETRERVMSTIATFLTNQQ